MVVFTSNSRDPQGPEYVVEFFKVLPRDLKLAIQSGDEKTKEKVGLCILSPNPHI